MKKSKHTPGPWMAHGIEPPWIAGGDGGVVEAVTEDGKMVRREICSFMIETDELKELEEDLANARLLAAAYIGHDLAVAAERLDPDRPNPAILAAIKALADKFLVKIGVKDDA